MNYIVCEFYLNKAILKTNKKKAQQKKMSLAICPSWNKYTILMNQNRNYNIYIHTQYKSKFY